MLIDAKKTYIFTVKFGTQTDSDDYASIVYSQHDYIPPKENAYAICSEFIGNITQTPPAFSALKVNGVRAYKLSREGKPVELKPRNITIYDLKCLKLWLAKCYCYLLRRMLKKYLYQDFSRRFGIILAKFSICGRITPYSDWNI